jgi:hypothetical protein
MRRDIRWTICSDRFSAFSLHRSAAGVLHSENLTDRHYIATQTGPIKTLGSPLLIMGGIRAEF